MTPDDPAIAIQFTSVPELFKEINAATGDALVVHGMSLSDFQTTTLATNQLLSSQMFRSKITMISSMSETVRGANFASNDTTLRPGYSL